MTAGELLDALRERIERYPGTVNQTIVTSNGQTPDAVLYMQQDQFLLVRLKDVADD